jgi:hypothetical protein
MNLIEVITLIKKLDIKIRKSDNRGIFHDSRSDVNTLMKICVELINKVNELTDELNELKKKNS